MAIDLDGTLLNNEDEMNHETQSRLIDLAKSGVILAIVTGRPLVDAKRFAQQIGAPYTVALNGAVVGAADGSPLYVSDPIPEVALNNLLQLAGYHRATVNFHTASEWYPMLSTAEQMRAYGHRRGMEPTRGKRGLGTVRQAEVVGSPEVIERIAAGATSLHGVSITTARDAFASYVDVAPKTVSKSFGLSWILSKRQIVWSKVMAFGDGENDIPPFHLAGVSVAVPGSSDAVRESATHQIYESPSCGVLTGIKALIDHDPTAAGFVSCYHE